MSNILQEIGINNYIYLSVLLFCVGVLGILFRRSAIVMLMSVELMLASANMLLAVFSVYHQDASGQVFVVFSMAVAAAEVAVGLAILVAIFRNIGSIDIEKLKNLKG
ncbi:NADH-quinone oxidoreductase subunit NuoK [Dysgonomonas sp. 520]|uniref:NADH-quinone oxidoreductase subunit NuoK n=1 Tax=Dysgonomonas sp. 520 TaxID=2302931 RepID=UPI0013D365BD|nr:NADH-quinone oxidoreductase subunit NuoK [Dysgonomonas sp. 520]NDW08923.1 NADH-quinone oxidoreductase subunit NuoK [Dysgonomonas sp. 520]